MSNIVKSGGRALSEQMAKGLLAGITDSRSSTPIVGGRPLLRLLRDGEWVFGQADDPVQQGSEWAVNPLSIMHGYSCWTNNPDPKVKNTLLGEVMVPIMEHKPILPEPINGFPFKEQRAFELKCVLGDDEGVEVTYKTSSVGGMRGVDNFLAELQKQIMTGTTNLVAIVQLEASPYEHSSYGRIYNPILNVVGWADMDGNREEVEEPTDPTPLPPKKASAKAPVKKVMAPITKAATKAVEAEEEAEDEVEETVAATAPQRQGAAPRRQRPSVSA